MVRNAIVFMPDFIRRLEAWLGKSPHPNIEPMRTSAADAAYTYTDWFRELAGFAPLTQLSTGIQHLVDWHIKYCRVQVRT